MDARTPICGKKHGQKNSMRHCTHSQLHIKTDQKKEMYTNTKETADMKQTGGLWQKKFTVYMHINPVK